MQQGVISSFFENDYQVKADKRRVAANFSKAATTYDCAAALQDRVAARTMSVLPAGLNPDIVLDMGSGTGSQTIQVAEHYSRASTVGMDMAMGMLSHARSRYAGLDASINWCSGDIESLPFQSGCLDIVFSSLAIQWCSLGTVLKEVYRVLKPGGWFVFSTLAAGTMHELQRAWSVVDQHTHVNDFDRYLAQEHTVQQSMFAVHSFKQQTEMVHYPSALQLLRDLKALGVTTIPSRQQGLTSRNRILQMQNAYEAFRTKAGLPLSYQVVYGILHKPLQS